MDNETKMLITAAITVYKKMLTRKIDNEFNPLIKDIYRTELGKIAAINLERYEEKKKGA